LLDNGGRTTVQFVESRMGASTDAEALPRFPSPLISMDLCRRGFAVSRVLAVIELTRTGRARLWSVRPSGSIRFRSS
jgi:hypothetical protein